MKRIAIASVVAAHSRGNAEGRKTSARLLRTRPRDGLRLLLRIEKDFSLQLGDLQGAPLYAAFVRSPEYQVFRSRKRPSVPEEEPED